MVREIPGYYYDESKKKYFKIQKNHTVPTGSAHSVDGVKRRKIEDQAASRVVKQLALSKGRIRRVAITQTPLLGGLSDEESGYRRGSDGRARGYSQELNPRVVLESSSSISIKAFDYHTAAVSRSAVHPAIKSLWSSVDDTQLWAFPYIDASPPQPIDEEGLGPKYNKPPFPRHRAARVLANTSQISTITINHATGAVLTTWQAAQAGPNIVLSTPYYVYGELAFATMQHTPAQDERETIWDATSGISGSSIDFLVATDRGLIKVQSEYPGYSGNVTTDPVGNYGEYLAVSSLAQKPSVFLAGDRRGRILLRDYRAKEDPRRIIFRHPKATFKIRSLSEHLVTVSGAYSTLCNYDLRYPKHHAALQIWPTDAAHYDQKVTTPVVTYPEHTNSARHDLGFDVDSDAGIVAAVQDDDHRTIKIFSASSGRMLRSIDAAEVEPQLDPTRPVHAVRFVDYRADGGMKSLWVAKGSGIVSYEW